MVSFATIFFLAHRHHQATGQSTCGATRTLTEGEANLGYPGCHDVVLLELAGLRMLPGKKVISQMAFLPAQMRKGGQVHEGRY